MNHDAEFIQSLIEKVKRSVDLLYENDSGLLENNLHEDTIGTQLKAYLDREFPDYSVDCNYNRHYRDIKKKLDNKKFRPDIIIHHRQTDDHNLIYFELKTEKNTEDRQKDIDTILYVTSPEEAYGYDLGVFIDFTVNKENIIIRYFVDGEEWI